MKREFIFLGVSGFGIIALGYWLFVSFIEHERVHKANFTVMTCNIGIEQSGSVPPKKMADINAWVLTTGRPDILLLQEFMGGVNLKDLADRLNYRYFLSGRSMLHSSGLTILSDFPLVEEDALSFNTDTLGDGALSAVADVFGRRILLCTLHMSTLNPKLRPNGNKDYTLKSLFRVAADEIFREGQHVKNTRRLLSWLNSKDWDAAVVGGDFNTIFLAGSIRLMTRSFDDVLWPSWDFFRGTKISKIPLPIRPRIDYIFHSGELSVKAAVVLDQTIGDHLPVVTEFSLHSVAA